MKIAFITSTFPKLSESFVLNQITGLIDLGHEVRIFSRRSAGEKKVHPDFEKYCLNKYLSYSVDVPSGKMLCRLKALSAILPLFFIRPVATIRLINCLMREEGGFSYEKLFFFLPILRGKFDIVHCHFGLNGNFALCLKKALPSVRMITSFHGHDVNSYPRTAGVDVYKELFKRGDLFTVNSNFTKDKVVKLGCDEKKIRLLPVGLKIEAFPFSQRAKPGDSHVKILSVGRLVEKKGYEYAIRAVAKVVGAGFNIKYSIVGDGELKDKLRQLTAELGMEDNIEFSGALAHDKIVGLYEQAHIFVLSSVTASNGDMEGQGLVLQEAQATGLAVISTLHNGIPDGVLDGKSAFLVPEKDVDALAEKLEYLICHPEIWPRMGTAGREFVEKNYDVKLLNKKLEGIYKELLGK